MELNQQRRCALEAAISSQPGRGSLHCTGLLDAALTPPLSENPSVCQDACKSAQGTAGPGVPVQHERVKVQPRWGTQDDILQDGACERFLALGNHVRHTKLGFVLKVEAPRLNRDQLEISVARRPLRGRADWRLWQKRRKPA